MLSDIRKTGDVASLMQFLLATQSEGATQFVDGCNEVQRHVRSHPLPQSRTDDAAWAQATAALMERPQRTRAGLKSSPRGPKSPVQSWTAVLNIGAEALAGLNGDVAVATTAAMSRLGITSDDDSWRWVALSLPDFGLVVRRIQLAATPQDNHDPTWSLLSHESWAQRTVATVAADAARGYLL